MTAPSKVDQLQPANHHAASAFDRADAGLWEPVCPRLRRSSGLASPLRPPSNPSARDAGHGVVFPEPVQVDQVARGRPGSNQGMFFTERPVSTPALAPVCSLCPIWPLLVQLAPPFSSLVPLSGTRAAPVALPGARPYPLCVRHQH